MVVSWSIDNLKDKHIWLRVAYTTALLVVFYVLWNKLFSLLLLVWFGQTVHWLFCGRVHEGVSTYMRFFAVTFYHHIEYLMYVTSEKPYPLSMLP
jgi:hypothetical protein